MNCLLLFPNQTVRLWFVGFKAFKFYLRPTAEQARNLDRIRLICCELYNAGLQEKRDAYRKLGINLNCAKQQAELTDVKAARPDVKAVNAQVLQNVLKRLHRAFDGFFRRVKSGQRPGYPRFRSERRYDSFTFPQVSHDGPLKGGGIVMATNGRLLVHGVPGLIKVKWHRQLESMPKTATFKREGKRWYVIFACDNVPIEALPETGRDCGLDLGLTTFAMLDDGTAVNNPRLLRHAEGNLRRAQRRLSRRKRGSQRRNKARELLAGHHRHIANERRDHIHKVARTLVNSFDRIAVEKLNVQGLASGCLSKSVNDAGWGMFLAILVAKAANAGREVVAVDPAGTSQVCSGCGVVVRKSLSERVHRCADCGLVLDRDVNAARNIRLRAFGPGNGLRRGEHDVSASNDPRSRLL
jgi:putative transposase